METMERNTKIIETARIRNRFTRALSTYDNQADAQHRICEKLAGILNRYIGTRYNRMLEIGCGTGSLTLCLKNRCSIGEWVLNDLCEACREPASKLFSGPPPVFISGDAEKAAFIGLFDLIASASAFQWMSEPELFLHKLAGLLTPKGTLLLSTFAPGNLYEIKELTGKGLHYPTSETLTEWLSSDFHILHTEEENIQLTFDTPMDVLQHLKATGVTATGSGRWTRGIQEDFIRRYSELFRTGDNQVTLTYRPLYLLAVKK